MSCYDHYAYNLLNRVILYDIIREKLRDTRTQQKGEPGEKTRTILVPCGRRQTSRRRVSPGPRPWLPLIRPLIHGARPLHFFSSHLLFPSRAIVSWVWTLVSRDFVGLIRGARDLSRHRSCHRSKRVIFSPLYVLSVFRYFAGICVCTWLCQMNWWGHEIAISSVLMFVPLFHMLVICTLQDRST